MKEKEKEILQMQGFAEEMEDEVLAREETPREDADHEEEHHHSHHHSHHHHHHSSKHRHHHSKRKSSKKFSFRKLKKSFKKHKKIWIPIALILLVATILLAVMGLVELFTKKESIPTAQNQGTNGAVILSVSAFDEALPLVNSATNVIMTHEAYTEPSHVVLDGYADSTARLDMGSPVKLFFSLNNKPANYVVEKIKVDVADNENFLNSWVYHLDPSATSLDIFNLKTGTQYYYRINMHFTNGSISYAGGTFKTATSPRILTVGGVYNARDIGGWITVNGQVIRQGLLYRGTELDGSVESKYKLTDDGKHIMLNHLGIKTDMDLRWEEQNTSGIDALGADVNHIYFGVENYTNIFLPDYYEAVRNVFSELAKAENYPIYMHCTYGRDRTGTICCLLEALLGAREEDLWRDYLLSALENPYQDNISFGSFILALKNQPGETLKENVENYLLSIGVTAEEIAAIRSIYLG